MFPGRFAWCEDLIREKAADLERLCGNIISCRIVVEVPQQYQKSGRPYRVRINVNIPPGLEVVVRRESSEGILHDDFDRLEIGTGVRLDEEMGEKGPQASTVQIVDKQGARIGSSGEAPIEPPLGWGQ
jgi:hypothetical protein